MFRSIALGKVAKLQELGGRLLSVHQDATAALLCLDHVFYGKPVKIQPASSPEAVSLLEGFLCYVKELQRVALEQQPVQDPALQRLFGFYPLDGVENAFLLPPGTFFHRFHHRRQNNATSEDESQPLTLNGYELTNLFQSALRERLKRGVADENTLCARARAIFPCPTLSMFGVCNSRECSGAHEGNIAPDLSDFKNRVRVVFQQILIYQTINSLEDRAIVAKQRRYARKVLPHITS